jgi:hypothetical protein
MNWKRFAAFTFAVLAVLLLGYQPAWSQATNATGSIEGVVTDPQGGVLPNVKITVTRADTGQVINLTASSAGEFSTGPIVPGNYAVRFEAPSFKTYQTSVVAQVGQITTANAKLEVGSSSTVIEVTGTAVSVNTEQSQLSGDLTAAQIENLPINGRNFLDLAQLEPGVQIQDGGNFDPTKIGFSSISFGGKFGRSARISVDGVDVSDENVGTTTTGLPSTAIQEFQLAQSSLDISNDLTSGGSVNVITKSGSNSLHGEAFGLYRDDSQAAAYPGGAKFQRGQYGGDVGGPIIKDKLFFFADAERLLAHDAGGVLVAPPLNSFSGTFPARFSDTSTIGRLDYSISKNIKAFGRFSYWQASDVGNFGGAANYSVYDNKDRTKTIAGGVDFNEGSFTHSFRAEYLKFVNVISDAVQGSSLPFAFVPNEILLSGTGFETGPSFLAPQSTIQSDRQVKYDGSHVWGSHIIRWGVDYNRITGWTFASFFGLTPQDVSSFLFAPGTLTCPGGQTGSACPLNYTADTVAMGNGEGSFTELKRFGKPAGGLGPDNRVGAYIGDSWKVKPNFTLSYGIRYDRDTGRTDSDISLPAINNFIPGAGNAVRQPNHNFAPQAGFAWDPKSNGKTVIRGGVGIFYDNIVFNDVLFDRELKLASGQFNAVQNACNSGSAGGMGTGGVVGFGDGSAHLLGVAGAVAGKPTPAQQATANSICNTPIGATIGAGGGNCAGQIFFNCTAAFQTALQASFAANPVGANGIFLPGQLAAGGVNLTGAGFLDPNYKSPRSIQMNVGIQRELRPGMVFSADYVRNVGLHYLLSTDINKSGDVTNYDQTLGAAAVTATLAACGVGTVADAIIACPGLHATGGATMGDFSANGLDSANDKGPFPCPNCAFAASNRTVGAFYEFHSGGRSVYNGLDLKLVQNVQHPFTGVKYLNFQGTYTFSRYVNAGSIASGTNIAGGDADFVSTGLNNRNPLSLIGPGSLDRTHQFNFGGYADIPLGFRLGMISHFWSPFAATPTILPVASATNAGADGIFTSDFIGSGQVGNPLPIAETDSTCGTMGGECTYNLYHVGAFMRSLGPQGLTKAVANYDATIGGTLPTPAGQALINQGLFTLAQLQALGGVATHVAPVVPGQVGLGWLKAFDLEFSWVGHFFHERLTIQPSVNFYNLFNFSNFDSAANALSGQLNGAPGSINGTVQAGRPDRIGAGTGVFAFGAPRTIEWGLKLQF